jgi:hypothetical protein
MYRRLQPPVHNAKTASPNRIGEAVLFGRAVRNYLLTAFSAFASPQEAFASPPAQQAFLAFDLETDFTSGVTDAVEAVPAAPFEQHDALLLAHSFLSVALADVEAVGSV